MNNPNSSPYLKLWLVLSLTILLLSTVLISINYFTIQYPGNNYFPKTTPFLVIFCILLMSGAYILDSPNKAFKQFTVELVMFFLTMVTITYATNAVQLTPFPLIDNVLISFEQSLGFYLINVMGWVQQYPWLVSLLTFSYATLAIQMAFIPLAVMLLIFFKSNQVVTRLRRYYCMMLLTTILGFTIYYFFPTAAPATFLKSQYFTAEQYSTGTKLLQIRDYIQPTTKAGGLIALPSHHTIWAILCLYLIYPFKTAFYLLLANNCLLIIACVVLGWHYPIDIIAAFLIVWLAFRLTKNTQSEKIS